MSGYFRTALLLAAMTALFLGIGYVLGGSQGAVIAFFFALATNAWAWWNSDRMVLAMHNAEPVTPEQAPRLYQLVQGLAARAGIPMPALYVIHEDQPNAFATGRDPEHAAVAVNTGLLDLLSEEEAAGVIAHELAHIRHRDTLIMTITATLAGAIGMLAQFGFLFGGRDQDGRRSAFGPIGALLLMVVGPLAAMLVQMAISRSREYEADRGGAEICGNPRWLASALLRLEQGAAARVNATAEANPATAHLFIVNPLHGGALAGLFRTHPPIEERVARLMSLEGGAGGWGGGGGHAQPSAWGGAQARPQPPRYPTNSPWGAGGRRNPWG